MEKKEYYLGLDIGTDSIGYAVTNEQYDLLRFHGEKMWGATLFDPAGTCAERRSVRTSRRRLHRRQHRIQMLKEIFAEAVAKADPCFFQRIEESWKLAKDKTDTKDTNAIFNDSNYSDKDYYKQYPTIHHLICELMENKDPHDVRLVYLVLAWFMAHRGHFFSDLSVDGILAGGSFNEAYENLIRYFDEQKTSRQEDIPDNIEYGWWDNSFSQDLCCKLKNAMQRVTCISRKEEEIKEILKLEDGKQELYPLKLIIKLLAGGKVQIQKLMPDYEEEGSLSLDEDEDKLDEIIINMGEEGELIRLLKQLFDGAALVKLLQGKTSISKAKIEVFEQHRKDLHELKRLIKTYLPDDLDTYRKLFSAEGLNNYPAYISEARGKVSILEFNDFLKKSIIPLMKDKPFSTEDKNVFDEMSARIELNAFMPKQVTKDNRTIPYQLYEAELRVILNNAKNYLPFLTEIKEGCKVTESEKILSIFTFRTPYYIGPQAKQNSGRFSPFAWLIRKSNEPVRPWNLEEVVDTNASEREFINRMANNCTYCPGKKVLPINSLLYQRFIVLNEINNLRVNGEKISVEAKQEIYEELFKKHKRVTRTQIINYLKASGYPSLRDDELSGIDIKINSSLTSYHAFKPFLESKKLTSENVENIIFQRTCTEDSKRFLDWLKKQEFTSSLNDEEIKKISRISLKDFGRLSEYFLAKIVFSNKSLLEKGTVIQFMWDTNNNLNELLSEQYTLKSILETERKEYYTLNPQTFEDKLDDLYLSSAVKRQIYRSKDIVDSVVHAMKGASPKRIFVEMARGASPEQKKQRTISRQDQLIEKLKHVKTVEVKEFSDALLEDGIQNRLQGDKLYLWFMQLGKCPYCGQPISREDLYNNAADIDHIYPQCLTKDDSILDNKVLAHKKCNGQKTDIYPLPEKMYHPDLWKLWLDNDLITKEKYSRLMRRTPFTDDEKQGFINRQLVETRQATKAVLNLLKERFPDTEVVAVKAGIVSEYRHEFDMLKCRSINDLHHAKDAYLNIVVGNVYNEIFNKNFYIDRTKYSMKTKTIFENTHVNAKLEEYWSGKDGIEETRKVLQDNHVHLTKYQISKTDGKLFDINIVGKGNGQIPRKKDQRISEYGGYNKPSMAGFVMVSYTKGKKGRECVLLPISLDGRDILLGKSIEKKQEYLSSILAEKGISNEITYPLGMRLLRMGTMFSFDGLRMVVAGRTNDRVILRLFSPFFMNYEQENYIKRIENKLEKIKEKKTDGINTKYDNISYEENVKLFDTIIKEQGSAFFMKLPGNPYLFLNSEQKRSDFIKLEITEQCKLLMNILSVVKTNRAGTIDLSALGGAKKAATIILSCNLSNWTNTYSIVRLIDTDAAGLFEKQSSNLLDYLK